MSASFLHLAVGSRDLSQAEEEITVCKAEQIRQKDSSKWSWVKKVVILSENSCHFVNLLSFAKSYLFLSLR